VLLRSRWVACRWSDARYKGPSEQRSADQGILGPATPGSSNAIVTVVNASAMDLRDFAAARGHLVST
jgi:hypothetical protein